MTDNIKCIITVLCKFGNAEFYIKLTLISNTVLFTTFTKHSQEDMCGDQLTTMIDSAKSLVTYFKQTNLKAHLKKTLKGSVETCGNSLHTMLESISRQQEDICTLLEEQGEVSRHTNVDEEVLSEIVTFLVVFQEATNALEAWRSLILHPTIVWYECIGRLQPSSTDSMTISSLMEKCLSILQEKFDIHPLHRLEMFLYPRLKSMKLLANNSEVANVHNETRCHVKGQCRANAAHSVTHGYNTSFYFSSHSSEISRISVEVLNSVTTAHLRSKLE